MEGPPDRRGQFPTTRWSIIRKLSATGDGQSHEAWEDFVGSYMPPLRAVMTGWCGDPHLAEELVQTLMVKLTDKRASLDGLDAGRGKMRTWLLVALKHQWYDQLRRMSRERALLAKVESEDVTTTEAASFDAEWAGELGKRAVTRLREEYRHRGKEALFHSLLAAADGRTDGSLRGEAADFGMEPNSYSVALKRFRQRLAERLREEVSRTVENDGEVEDELRHLIGVLSKHGGLPRVFDD